MIKFYTKFKQIIKKILLFFFNHKVNVIGINDDTIKHVNYHLVDLSQNLFLKKVVATLCSYEGDSSVAYSNKYPVIESWLKINKKTYTVNNFFQYDQFKKLKKTKSKKIFKINQNLFLLPYYTSHFGHFSGDLLGQILYYIKFFKEINIRKKLLVISPSEKWDNFLKKLSNKNILILSPAEALKKNYMFTNVQVLPRLSTVQNFILAKNILENIVKLNKNYPKKIFLTTNRKDRISNIDFLKNKLQKEGFKIIIPHEHEVFNLLEIIKSAEVLISEKGSILNNVLLVRNKKYFILSSKTETELDNKIFIGAGVYKELNRGLIEEIYCEDDPPKQYLRPYKKRIKVKIDFLLSKIKHVYD